MASFHCERNSFHLIFILLYPWFLSGVKACLQSKECEQEEKYEIPEGPEKQAQQRTAGIFLWFYFHCSYHKLILLLSSGKKLLPFNKHRWLIKNFCNDLFIGCVGSSLLCRCSSSCSQQLHSVVVLQLLIVVVCVDHVGPAGFGSCCSWPRAQAQ